MRRLAFLITLWLVALIAPAPAWASRSASEAIAIAMVVPATHRGEQEAATLQEGAISRSPNRAQREARARLRGSQRGETALVGAKHELDLAGNVRRLRSAGGGDLGGYRYSAFGKTLEDTATSRLDQPLRWKGRPREVFGAGLEVYDMRARWWCPELGSFLSIDAYRFHNAKGTLWSWPRQNPIRWRDPSGRMSEEILDNPDNDPDWNAGRQAAGTGALWATALGLAATELAAAAEAGALGEAAAAAHRWLFGAPAAAPVAKAAAEKACSIDQAAIQGARNACPNGQCNDMANALIRQLGQGRLVQLLPAKGDGLLPTTNPNLGWYQHTAVVTNAGEVLDPFTSTSYPSVDAWRASVVGAAEVLTLTDGAVTR